MAARCAISWSAGKDSWLALMRAREQGLAVATFVTMCDEDGAQQVARAGARRWSTRRCAPSAARRWACACRRGRVRRALRRGACAHLADRGHTHMVFGDIDLQAHRDWLAPACERAGLVPLFPLWGESRAALAHELVTRGVRARVVCVDTRWLDASFCGAPYDAAFLARLPAGVCPCGEDGEFHTFVAGGPGLRRAVRVVDGPQRRVPSQPPFAPTEFVFQYLSLAAHRHDPLRDGLGHLQRRRQELARDRAVPIGGAPRDAVKPFKAQNMSNNARVVAGLDGLGAEIGAAQYFQALAAGVEPARRHEPRAAQARARHRLAGRRARARRRGARPHGLARAQRARSPRPRARACSGSRPRATWSSSRAPARRPRSTSRRRTTSTSAPHARRASSARSTACS